MAVCLFLLFLLLDQLSKQFAFNQQWPIVYNRAVIFGLVPNFQAGQLAVSVLLLIWFVRRLVQSRPWPKRELLGWVMIWAGITGNWLDRWRWGAVVDFIDLRFWPVFNLADGFITGGLALVFLCLLK